MGSHGVSRGHHMERKHSIQLRVRFGRKFALPGKLILFYTSLVQRNFNSLSRAYVGKLLLLLVHFKNIGYGTALICVGRAFLLWLIRFLLYLISGIPSSNGSTKISSPVFMALPSPILVFKAVHLFGFGGRTVSKVQKHDLCVVSLVTPDRFARDRYQLCKLLAFATSYHAARIALIFRISMRRRVFLIASLASSWNLFLMSLAGTIRLLLILLRLCQPMEFT